MLYLFKLPIIFHYSNSMNMVYFLPVKYIFCISIVTYALRIGLKGPWIKRYIIGLGFDLITFGSQFIIQR